MTLARHAILLAAALIAAPTTGALAQSQATFGDWTAGCDNTGRCVATGFASDMTGLGWMRLERDPQPEAAAHLQIVLDTEGQEKEIVLEAKFDDPGFEAALPSPVRAVRDSNDRFVVTVPPAGQGAILQAMRKATTLTLRRTDGQKLNRDADATSLSLKGSVAALRWLDERQNRAGNVTALIATGPAPASAMPRPPAIPNVRLSRHHAGNLGQKAPAAVIEAWKSACDEWDEHEGMKGQGHEIAGQTQLWMMPCSRGAYNFGSMAFLMRGAQKPQHLKFEQWQSGEKWNASRFEIVAEELINAEFSPQDMSIRFFSKGRGIGDCGSSGAYAWDGQRFRMTSYALMGECRGVPDDGWLTLWRADISR